MKEVLSQSEIDSLLHALNTGELETKDIESKEEGVKVKPYDFRRPNKFSQDQLRTLFLMHDNFARLSTNFLSAYLRSNIQIKIASVDQLTYEDFIMSIPTPTLLTVFSMSPLPGTSVLETNAPLVFPIIDLLFGGAGKMPEKVRELTDIEINVFKSLNQKLLDNLVYVWSDVIKIKPKVEYLETNPQLSQIISPNEIVAVITLSSSVGGQEGMCNICLPFAVLEQVVGRLSATHWLEGQRSGRGEDSRLQIERKLDAVPVDLEVLAGETSLKVRDFLQLQVGDVIPLEKAIDEDMDLIVNKKNKFKVQPGRVGKKVAVQVTETLIKGAGSS